MGFSYFTPPPSLSPPAPAAGISLELGYNPSTCCVRERHARQFTCLVNRNSWGEERCHETEFRFIVKRTITRLRK